MKKKLIIFALFLFCFFALPTQAKTLSKKEKWRGSVTASTLNVRTWAGTEYDTVIFSPLKKKTKVIVCDTVEDSKGAKWYYIRYNGHYGFVHSKYIKKNASNNNAEKFLNYLANYSEFIKNHPRYFYYHYDSYMYPFSKVIKRVEKQKKMTGCTCLMPTGWALHEIGVHRKDGKPWVYGYNGSFKKNFTGNTSKYLIRITSGGPIGLTVTQAVDKGLLKPGDICAHKGRTHTFTYSGKGYLVYDGGHAAKYRKYKTGVLLDYHKISPNNKRIISEVLRWR